MVLDQYASRGGSALADGCRMVTVLQAWENADGEKLAPPIGFTLAAGEQGIVMARAKISYAPPQPLIWLKRCGWTFEHFIDMPATKEDEASARADQVWRYLADQLKSGARHSQKTLEDSGVMPRAKLRAALSSLLAAGRVIYAPLPEELRHGGRKDYLHPVGATSPPGANNRGEVGQKKVPLHRQAQKPPLPRRHPIGKKTAARYQPPIFPYRPITSPARDGEVAARMAR
jgi:RecA-family ATPase